MATLVVAAATGHGLSASSSAPMPPVVVSSANLPLNQIVVSAMHGDLIASIVGDPFFVDDRERISA